MRSIHVLVLSFALILTTSGLTVLNAEVTIDPIGVAVSLEQNDTLAVEAVLQNTGGTDISYRLTLQPVEENRRDRRGEPDDFGYFWVDNNEDDGPDYQWENIANRQGAVQLQAGNNWNSGELELGFEFPWYGEWYPSIRVCENGWITFDPEQDGTFSDLPRFPNEDEPNNMLAVNCTELSLTDQSSIWFWTDEEGRAVVSWLAMAPPFAPVRPDLNMQIILIAETGTVLYQYGNQAGLQNNASNVGYENQDGSLGGSIIFHEAGVANGLAIAITGPISRWLTVEPREGVIPAEDEETLEMIFESTDIEAGSYEIIVSIELAEADNRDDLEENLIMISAIMSVETPVANVTGTVTSAGTDDPIEGAMLSVTDHYYARFTNEDGEYLIENAPVTSFEVTVTAADYLPYVGDVNIEEAGEFEWNVELLHSECTPSREEFFMELEPDMDHEFDFRITNGGNGPLTYTVERRLLGGADAEPWEQRHTGDLEEVTNDDMLNGIVFADGHFFVSGGNNGEDVSKIYKINTDGELVDEFDQFNESRYGMRDLAYDGNLIWGADDGTFYGFNTECELEISFESPVNIEGRSIAWDPDNHLLIASDVATDIYAIDVEGNLVETFERPQELRIYGLGFWPDDPEGYDLYVFCRGDSTDLQVNKLNLEDGEFILAAELDVDGGRPGGVQITNQVDVYSWVFVSIVQNPDRLNIWQLAARREWFQVDPVEGMIEAEEREDFILTLDATGLPLENTFEGEVVFSHDGVGGETAVSVRLEVVEGQVRTTRDIPMEIGWNLVSTNLQPDDEENIRGLMAALVEEELLVLMKNSDGEFYRPDYDYNNIPGWYVNEGYQMLVSGDCVLTLEGISVLRDRAIPLEQGWQIVSYYPRSSIDAIVALSGIVDHLIIAKDGRGNFYLPAWDFSNMGDMREGQGYYLNVDEDVELVYQTGEEANALSGGVRHSSVYDAPGRLPVHVATGENMSLLVTADVPPMLLHERTSIPPLLLQGGSKGGSEIGVYADGQLVGSGVLQDGICGIAVWGNDPMIGEINGALEGQELELRLIDENSSYDVDFDILAGKLIYETNSFCVLRLNPVVEAPTEFGIVSVYPNPFNSKMTVTYSLPEAVRIELKLFNIAGREITTLIYEVKQPGVHTTNLTATDLPSGLYFVRLEASGQVFTQKVMLIR